MEPGFLAFILRASCLRLIHLCMHRCNGGDLQQLIDTQKKMSEASARICFHQIVTALSYLHAQKIVHRGETALTTAPSLCLLLSHITSVCAMWWDGRWHSDLKPENILVKKPSRGRAAPKLVLVDFGVCSHANVQWCGRAYAWGVHWMIGMFHPSWPRCWGTNP